MDWGEQVTYRIEARVWELREVGVSVSEIGRKCGISRQAVYRILGRPPGTHKAKILEVVKKEGEESVYEAIFEMWAKGMSVHEVAGYLGISRKRIWQAIGRHVAFARESDKGF